jgi:hypothetical protein
MTASRPLPWTVDRLIPGLYSADWPSQPLTAQVSMHADAVTGTWQIGMDLQPRFVPFGDGTPPEPPDDRVYRLDLAPGGRYRLELITGTDPALDDDDADETGDEDPDPADEDDGTDPWASAVADDAASQPAPGQQATEPADADAGPDSDPGRPWRGYCSDGTSHWTVKDRRAITSADPALPAPIQAMFRPSWLVSGYDLALDGTEETAGRTALRITATPRPLARGQFTGRDLVIDRFTVLADPDLGLLLRREVTRDGRTDETALITSLTLGQDPDAASQASFRPPPALPIADTIDNGENGAGPAPRQDGAAWRLAKSAAGALGEGLGFAVRHTPRTPPPAGTPPMPDSGPPDTEPVPLPAGLVNLLHRTGQPAACFTATATTWIDGEAIVAAGQAVRTDPGSPLPGLLGPEDLWAALTDRPPADQYLAERITVGPPGRYRVDQLATQDARRVRTVASDGERYWAVYANRVVVLPATAQRLDEQKLRLADPSWLLGPGWRLSAFRPQEIGGRDGWLLWAQNTGTPGTSRWDLAARGLLPQVCVVVDAELGVLLRITGYADGKPAMCTELTGLTVLPADDLAPFTPELPDGVPVIHGRTKLDELNMPAPVRAVFGAVSRVWRARPPGGPA